MKNKELAGLFNLMADIMEIKGARWEPIAYRKAARNIESLSKDVEEIYYKKGIEGLQNIPGVGKGISKDIVEYLEKDKISGYNRLLKSIPKGLIEMMDIQSLGPKKIMKLHNELKIKSIRELKAAIKAGRVRKLDGFGEKSEQDILEGIDLFKKRSERSLIGRVIPIAEEIKLNLESIKGVLKVEVAGSIRRRKETIRDIDILVVSKFPERVMDVFTSM